MFDKGIDPRGLRRGRTADPQTGIHALDGSGSMVIEFPVRGLPGIPCPEIQIGFVPDLEVPLCDFIDTVAIDQMLSKYGNEVAPFIPVLWRRNVRLVPEAMQSVLSRQLLRHEAELDKRLHAVGQETVINLIDIGEIVDGLPLTVLVVQTDLVVKNGVEANVFEIRG